MIRTPNCHVRMCIHLGGVRRSNPEQEATEFNWCAAFPEGIPDEISYGSNKHLKPFLGDHDIQFEKETK